MIEQKKERKTCKVGLLTKEGKSGPLYAIQLTLEDHEFHMDMEGALKIADNIMKCIEHAKEDFEQRSQSQAGDRHGLN